MSLGQAHDWLRLLPGERAVSAEAEGAMLRRWGREMVVELRFGGEDDARRFVSDLAFGEAVTLRLRPLDAEERP